MTRIIINGDDFGMTESCTGAIAAAFGRRLITDTTMTANGAVFVEAAALARKEGFSDRIGIHFNLTEGEPLTKGICAITDFVKGGSFHKGYTSAPRPLNDEECEAVYAELSAQIMRIRSAGIRITHADSHHYVHSFAHLAPIAARVCREHGIDRIRLNRTIDTPAHPAHTENRIDNRYWRENGFVTSAHFGRLSDCFETAIPDCTEILVHPDFDKDGRLIDRTAVVDGYPDGEPLDRIDLLKDSVKLIGYRDLLMMDD